MSTIDTKERILVWTRTERAGDIVTIDKTEGDFTLFTDGTKCYTNIIGEEFFMEAKSLEMAESMAIPFKGPSDTPVAPKGPDGPQPTAKVDGELNVMLEMLKKISAKNTITMPLELNVPSKEVYQSRPEKVPYPSNAIKYGHYGKIMEDMVKAATEFKEGEEKQKLVKHIANLLKTSYLQWNRDSVNDNLIIKQLEELSSGKLTIDADQFRETNDILRTFKKKKSNNSKNYSKNKNRRKDYGGF